MSILDFLMGRGPLNKAAQYGTPQPPAPQQGTPPQTLNMAQLAQEAAQRALAPQQTLMGGPQQAPGANSAPTHLVFHPDGTWSAVNVPQGTAPFPTPEMAQRPNMMQMQRR